MRPIFLIGYMGSGKTTVGRILARQYGIEHIDLDWRIEQRFHTKISDMFAEIGEDGFRRRERKAHRVSLVCARLQELFPQGIVARPPFCLLPRVL